MTATRNPSDCSPFSSAACKECPSVCTTGQNLRTEEHKAHQPIPRIGHYSPNNGPKRARHNEGGGSGANYNNTTPDSPASRYVSRSTKP